MFSESSKQCLCKLLAWILPVLGAIGKAFGNSIGSFVIIKHLIIFCVQYLSNLSVPLPYLDNIAFICGCVFAGLVAMGVFWISINMEGKTASDTILSCLTGKKRDKKKQVFQSTFMTVITISAAFIAAVFGKGLTMSYGILRVLNLPELSIAGGVAILTVLVAVGSASFCKEGMMLFQSFSRLKAKEDTTEAQAERQPLKSIIWMKGLGRLVGCLTATAKSLGYGWAANQFLLLLGVNLFVANVIAFFSALSVFSVSFVMERPAIERAFEFLFRNSVMTDDQEEDKRLRSSRCEIHSPIAFLVPPLAAFCKGSAMVFSTVMILEMTLGLSGAWVWAIAIPCGIGVFTVSLTKEGKKTFLYLGGAALLERCIRLSSKASSRPSSQLNRGLGCCSKVDRVDPASLISPSLVVTTM